MEINFQKQKQKKLLEEKRKKEEALNGGKKKMEKPKPKPARRARKQIALIPIRTISPRQTRSKRKSNMIDNTNAIAIANANGAITSTAAAGNGVGANINVNNPNAAVTKALDTGGIIQSSTGLLSLPLGAPLGSTPSNADKKKPMKTDEEILEELEPNVSRPLPPAMLPYFEGDFWVSEGELILKFFMKDDIKKKLEEEERKILDAGGRRARKRRRTKKLCRRENGCHVTW